MPKDSGLLPAVAMPGSPELFDGQAGFFEERAGLPEESCSKIATAVLELGATQPADLIVEVGSGTGQLGQWFRKPVRYAGLDFSAGMLKEFSRRLETDNGNHLLIQADANARWPFVDGVARVVFSSRAMHLLEQEHVAREILRVAAATATLILGRVERKPESVRARMANEMNERLRRHGFAGRRGERQNRKLFELCCRPGAISLAPLSVATWRTSASPRQSLDSWRQLKGLGGTPVPDATRANILRELEGWAEEEFGGLDKKFESEETYMLKSLRLPPTREE
ncbi:MAG: class I SAM-dependent methyltransferase [Pyrinomonadaceae bacterium]